MAADCIGASLLNVGSKQSGIGLVLEFRASRFDSQNSESRGDGNDRDDNDHLCQRETLLVGCAAGVFHVYAFTSDVECSAGRTNSAGPTWAIIVPSRERPKIGLFLKLGAEEAKRSLPLVTGLGNRFLTGSVQGVGPQKGTKEHKSYLNAVRRLPCLMTFFLCSPFVPFCGYCFKEFLTPRTRKIDHCGSGRYPTRRR